MKIYIDSQLCIPIFEIRQKLLYHATLLCNVDTFLTICDTCFITHCKILNNWPTLHCTNVCTKPCNVLHKQIFFFRNCKHANHCYNAIYFNKTFHWREKQSNVCIAVEENFSEEMFYFCYICKLVCLQCQK